MIENTYNENDKGSLFKVVSEKDGTNKYCV